MYLCNDKLQKCCLWQCELAQTQEQAQATKSILLLLSLPFTISHFSAAHVFVCVCECCVVCVCLAVWGSTVVLREINDAPLFFCFLFAFVAPFPSAAAAFVFFFCFSAFCFGCCRAAIETRRPSCPQNVGLKTFLLIVLLRGHD